MPRKTVYVLGAGASVESGFPLQRDILPRIVRRLPPRGLTRNERKVFSTNAEMLQEFLSDIFSATEKTIQWLSLEDVMGTLDRIIAGRQQVKSVDPPRASRIRRALDTNLILLFDAGWRATHEWGPAACFGLGLTLRRLSGAQSSDPHAVVSTNWDASLDLAIEQWAEVLAEAVAVENDVDPETILGPAVDYGIYDYLLRSRRDDWNVPSTQLKGHGYYNIKVFKLHGSLNWLTCPGCSRVFTGLLQEFSVQEAHVGLAAFLGRRRCRLCPDRPLLQSLFVAPTFQKDLTHPALKQVWQNAHVELNEASRVVFCGYSFPHADHDFRYLLARAVRRDAEIEVVLPARGRKTNRANNEVINRYRAFFGVDRTTPRQIGFHEFVHAEFPEIPKPVTNHRASVKRLLAGLSPWVQDQCA